MWNLIAQEIYLRMRRKPFYISAGSFPFSLAPTMLVMIESRLTAANEAAIEQWTMPREEP